MPFLSAQKGNKIIKPLKLIFVDPKMVLLTDSRGLIPTG